MTRQKGDPGDPKDRPPSPGACSGCSPFSQTNLFWGIAPGRGIRRTPLRTNLMCAFDTFSKAVAPTKLSYLYGFRQ